MAYNSALQILPLPLGEGRGEGFRLQAENKETPDPGTATKDGRRAPGVHRNKSPRISAHWQE